jgi:hypothetical protein
VRLVCESRHAERVNVRFCAFSHASWQAEDDAEKLALGGSGDQIIAILSPDKDKNFVATQSQWRIMPVNALQHRAFAR